MNEFRTNRIFWNRDDENTLKATGVIATLIQLWSNSNNKDKNKATTTPTYQLPYTITRMLHKEYGLTFKGKSLLTLEKMTYIPKKNVTFSSNKNDAPNSSFDIYVFLFGIENDNNSFIIVRLYYDIGGLMSSFRILSGNLFYDYSVFSIPNKIDEVKPLEPEKPKELSPEDKAKLLEQEEEATKLLLKNKKSTVFAYQAEVLQSVDVKTLNATINATMAKDIVEKIGAFSGDDLHIPPINNNFYDDLQMCDPNTSTKESASKRSYVSEILQNTSNAFRRGDNIANNVGRLQMTNNVFQPNAPVSGQFLAGAFGFAIGLFGIK
jgi:hypothetical protein